MQNYIENSLSKNKVVIYIKGRPEDSFCNYSSKAVKVLDHYGVTYGYENIMESDDLRKAIKTYSGVKTLPQIFINGEYCGGSDDIRDMHEKGTLETFLKTKSVPVKLDRSAPKLELSSVTKDEIKSCGSATKPS